MSFVSSILSEFELTTTLVPFCQQIQAWDCIWDELIVKGRGLKTVYDRPGFVEEDYNFSAEMLEEMIKELNRLITKYDSPEWNTKATANKIVMLLTEHRALIQTELNEVNTGMRKLKRRDFLGPKERERRRILRAQEKAKNGETDEVKDNEPKQDYSKVFQKMEKDLHEQKIRDMRQLARQKNQDMRELAQQAEASKKLGAKSHASD